MSRPCLRCALALMLAALPAWGADLTVVVAGASPGGTVRAQVFRDAESFASQTYPVAAFAVAPRDGRVQVTIAGLPAGRYAVAAFHDVNGNQLLDRNWLGVPSEPVAFSHDARPGLTPVGFDEAAVEVLAGGLLTTLRLQ